MTRASEIFKHDTSDARHLIKTGFVDLLFSPLVAPLAICRILIGILVFIFSLTFFAFDTIRERKRNKKMLAEENAKWALIGVENPKLKVKNKNE